MRSLAQRYRSLYGAGIGHPVVLAVGFSLFGYVLSIVGVQTLWNPATWWQSIAVWFLGAVVLHDLILFPLYAAADGVLRMLLGRRLRPAVNYIRLPLMASALTFLLFLPGIISQGAVSFHAATGLDQSPYLLRWVALVAFFHVFSAAVYFAHALITSRSGNAIDKAQTGSGSAANHS